MFFCKMIGFEHSDTVRALLSFRHTLSGMPREAAAAIELSGDVQKMLLRASWRTIVEDGRSRTVRMVRYEQRNTEEKLGHSVRDGSRLIVTPYMNDSGLAQLKHALAPEKDLITLLDHLYAEMKATSEEQVPVFIGFTDPFDPGQEITAYIKEAIISHKLGWSSGMLNDSVQWLWNTMIPHAPGVETIPEKARPRIEFLVLLYASMVDLFKNGTGVHGDEYISASLPAKDEEYDYNAQTALEFFNVRKGICNGFAHFILAACRASKLFSDEDLMLAKVEGPGFGGGNQHYVPAVRIADDIVIHMNIRSGLPETPGENCASKSSDPGIQWLGFNKNNYGLNTGFVHFSLERAQAEYWAQCGIRFAMDGLPDPGNFYSYVAYAFAPEGSFIAFNKAVREFYLGDHGEALAALEHVGAYDVNANALREKIKSLQQAERPGTSRGRSS